jgi:hypothetical protein
MFFCLRRPGGRFLKKLPPWTPRKNFLRAIKSFDQTFSKVWPPAGPPEATPQVKIFYSVIGGDRCQHKDLS